MILAESLAIMYDPFNQRPYRLGLSQDGDTYRVGRIYQDIHTMQAGYGWYSLSLEDAHAHLAWRMEQEGDRI